MVQAKSSAADVFSDSLRPFYNGFAEFCHQANDLTFRVWRTFAELDELITSLSVQSRAIGRRRPPADRRLIGVALSRRREFFVREDFCPSLSTRARHRPHAIRASCCRTATD
jgi:hypothetical protein